MPRTFAWHPTKGPKVTGKNELTTGMVRIKQIRSGIGHSWRMNLTLKDSPALRGQLKQVRHLIEVVPVEESGK
jgi:large subunit ribosomal protein L30